MKKAAFSLNKYSFNQVLIDMDKFVDDNFNIDFNASGIYRKEANTYELNLVFKALNDEKKPDDFFVLVNCKAIFNFNVDTLEVGIPDYFYNNSIAIIYPFIRSFVSSITLQANIKLILLPTMNLSSLGVPLKANTQIID